MRYSVRGKMPLVIVLEPEGEVKLVDLAREDYEQPEMG